MLLVLTDTLASDDPAAWPSTTQLMGDRSELLRKLRDVSLKEEPTLTAVERSKVLKLTNVSEHVFLLISQLAHEYRHASGIDEAFLAHDPTWKTWSACQWCTRGRLQAVPSL